MLGHSGLRLRFRHRTILCSTAMLLLCVLGPDFGPVGGVWAAEWVVSSGEDATVVERIGRPGDSSTDDHFASVAEALAAARKAPEGESRRIVVWGGEYFLEGPVEVDQRDAGLALCAAEGTRPILYGGRRVSGWEKDGEEFYAADAAGVKEGEWDFRALVVNGELRLRARLPEEGTFTHESRFDVPWMSTTGGGWKRKPTQEELTTLRYKAGDIRPDLDVRNAEITVYHMWDESLVGVASIDQGSRTITFSNPSGHPPGAFGVHKYVVWNTREGMTRPGQWYLDRTRGKVVYWPLPEEDMSQAEVVAPSMESVLRIRGAENVTVRGLRLAVTTTPLVAGGFGAGRFDGAVDVRNTRNCLLEGLEVFNAAGQGIRVDGGSGVRIEGCHVHDVGACGIKAPSCTIRNNRVHHIGRIYPSAIGVWGGGKGCVISHNDVHHTPYSAINCGGEGHLIEGNRIHQAMLELHDGGAIYVFAGKNTVLRGNLAYDIPDTGGYGSSAYYLDERSTDCAIEGNVSIGIQRPTHNHMAHGNVVRNNVFLYDGDMRLTFPKSSDYRFAGNVLSAEGKITFENGEAITEWKNNILYSKAGSVIVRRMRDYNSTGEEGLAMPEGNSSDDPRITHFEDGRIQYGPGSPARQMGIEPIDVSDAGARR